MKVTVEVDCTAEEARRFLGIPDVVPIQQAIMEKLEQRMESAIDATTPEALLKAWMPIAPDQMQQAFAKLFGAFGGSVHLRARCNDYEQSVTWVTARQCGRGYRDRERQAILNAEITVLAVAPSHGFLGR
jgi:hypothetical protein